MTIDYQAVRGEAHGDYQSNARVAQAIKSVLRSGDYWPTCPPEVQEALDTIASRSAATVNGGWRDPTYYRSILDAVELALRAVERRIPDDPPAHDPPADPGIAATLAPHDPDRPRLRVAFAGPAAISRCLAICHTGMYGGARGTLAVRFGEGYRGGGVEVWACRGTERVSLEFTSGPVVSGAPEEARTPIAAIADGYQAILGPFSRGTVEVWLDVEWGCTGPIEGGPLGPEAGDIPDGHLYRETLGPGVDAIMRPDGTCMGLVKEGGAVRKADGTPVTVIPATPVTDEERAERQRRSDERTADFRRKLAAAVREDAKDPDPIDFVRLFEDDELAAVFEAIELYMEEYGLELDPGSVPLHRFADGLRRILEREPNDTVRKSLDQYPEEEP